ncbi:MAG TPA: hypothetical protein PK195_04860, partial [Ignavibacteriaceae bacterium]|nr:hypothetical protein [Ignavibacteriaceae bacterium]
LNNMNMVNMVARTIFIHIEQTNHSFQQVITTIITPGELAVPYYSYRPHSPGNTPSLFQSSLAQSCHQHTRYYASSLQTPPCTHAQDQSSPAQLSTPR